MRRFYLVLTILAIGIAGFIGYGYWQSMARPADLVSLKLQKDGAMVLGGENTLIMHFNLPWSATLQDVEVIPADNIIVAGSPKLKKHSSGFGYWVYDLQVTLRSVGIPEKIGKITVFYRHGGQNHALSAEMPPILTQETAEIQGEAPELADEVMVKEGFRLGFIHILGLVIGLLALMAWVFYRMSRKTQQKAELSVRMRAIAELDKLEKSVKSGSMPLDYAVFRLSDVVREYLEARYMLPASRLTTEEFLATLRRRKSVFTADNQGFLEEFMRTGDLIKFAKAHLEEPLVLQALSNAENLVESTSPDQEKPVEGRAQ